ncbi:MAG: carbonic anhydrase [Acidimicrobiia bacterium]
MSDLATLYQRNQAYAESFDQGDLPIKPNLSTLILSCVDARVHPTAFAGLEIGDAFVLRNVGARVTEAVGLEVAVVWTLMAMASGSEPSLELVIVQHTACGMARFADPEVAAKVTEQFGTPDVIATYAIPNARQTMTDDVERLRNNPVVPRALRVSGHLYDIGTGRLRELVPTTSIG